MRKRVCKGFTLVECVISMAIIMIISICFYSLISYANASFQKSVAVNVAVRQIDNALTVFENCSFKDAEDAGESLGEGSGNKISLSEFERQIGWAFDGAVESVESGVYVCRFNENGQLKGSGKIVVKFKVWQEAGERVCFNAEAFLQDKKIYAMKNDFIKLIK